MQFDQLKRRQFIALLGGVAAAWPLSSRAQQAGKVWRIGFLTAVSREAYSRLYARFQEGMRELGYVEGKDFVSEWRSVEGNYERFPELADELARLETISQMVSFNILASEGHAAVAMLWSKDHDQIKAFAESYVAQKPEHYSTLAIQTAFEFLENTSMQPAWWEGEKPIVRKLLLDRMQSAGVSLEEKRKPHCLTYGGVTYDQWDYDRHEFINVN
jgi:hypothetical protein